MQYVYQDKRTGTYAGVTKGTEEGSTATRVSEAERLRKTDAVGCHGVIYKAQADWSYKASLWMSSTISRLWYFSNNQHEYGNAMCIPGQKNTCAGVTKGIEEGVGKVERPRETDAVRFHWAIYRAQAGWSWKASLWMISTISRR